MHRIGSYILEGLLGQGGNGNVYRSTHPVLGRPVAVKALHQEIVRDPAVRARFLREAHVTIELNHPGIINVFDVDQDGAHVFIAMELLEHGSLADQLFVQRLPRSRVLDIAAQVADALDFAHCRGVVHRDIKPSNVLLRADDTPVVADFGLATDPAATSTLVAAGGQVLGTPAYMAPEQIRGRTIDKRTDMYAFGIMLYEMLTGHPPFGGPLDILIHKHLTAAPPAMRDVDPSIPAELESLVARLLAKAPAQRPAQMSEVAAALRAIRSKLPANDAPNDKLQPAPGATARRPAAAAGSAAPGGALTTPVVARLDASPPIGWLPIEILTEPLLAEPLAIAIGRERWSLGSLATYHSSASIRAYGVLRLDGAKPRCDPQVRIMLRDAAGNEILSSADYASHGYFERGDFGAFSITIGSDDAPLPAAGSYTVAWEVRSKSSPRRDQLGRQALPSGIRFGRRADNRFVWQATIGDRDRQVDDPFVVAILYGADNRVVGVSTAAQPKDAATHAPAGERLQLRDVPVELEQPPVSIAVLTGASRTTNGRP